MFKYNATHLYLHNFNINEVQLLLIYDYFDVNNALLLVIQ